MLVSGPIGDHGVTVMLARGELDIEADIESDTAPLHGITAGLLDAAGHGVRLLRDATRGGVATICNEVAVASQVAVVLDEAALPVRPVVNGASELLGHRPALRGLRGPARRGGRIRRTPTRRWPRCARTRSGEGAAVIGTVKDDPPGLVLLRTAFGGTRIVDLLVGDPLPGSAESPLMHELSITQSVVDAMTQRMRDAPVRRVRLEVGRLSGLVPDAVRFCFEMVAAGTTLRGRGAGDRRAAGQGAVPHVRHRVRDRRGAAAVRVRERRRRRRRAGRSCGSERWRWPDMCATCGCSDGPGCG